MHQQVKITHHFDILDIFIVVKDILLFMSFSKFCYGGANIWLLVLPLHSCIDETVGAVSVLCFLFFCCQCCDAHSLDADHSHIVSEIRSLNI